MDRDDEDRIERQRRRDEEDETLKRKNEKREEERKRAENQERMRAEDAISPRVYYSGPLLDGEFVVYDGGLVPEIGSKNSDIIGNRMDNTLIGNSGNNMIHGGEGIDSVIYSSNFNDYIIITSDDVTHIEDKNGDVIVSAIKAQKIKGWYKLEKAYEENESIIGKITTKCKVFPGFVKISRKIWQIVQNIVLFNPFLLDIVEKFAL